MEKKRSTFVISFLISASLLLAESALGQSYDLLVYSHHTPRILRYNGITGEYLGGFEQPKPIWDYIGMALGPDNFLYVTTATAQKLYRFDVNSGNVLKTVYEGSPFDHPFRMNFGPDGLLYLSNRDGDNVVRYDVVAESTPEVFVTAGSGGLDEPRGLTFGPDGNLYVAARTHSNILRFDGQTGDFIDEFVPSNSGGMAWPRAIEFGPDGNLYVCSYESEAILKFNGNTGEFISEFVPKGEGGLKLPIWMIFGPDENLYVANGGNTDSVLRFDGQTGAFIDTFIPRGLGGLNEAAELEFVPAAPRHDPPSRPDVSILPEDPTSSDDLICIATGSMIATGELEYLYSWHINGSLVFDVTGDILSAAYTKRGDHVSCLVTPTDGVLTGPPASSSVCIGNSPPPIPEFHLVPEHPSPSQGEGLAVWIDHQDPDPDGDPILYVFEWFESSDGEEWTRRPEVSGTLPPPVYSSGEPEISSLYIQVGDLWRVEVTAWDGVADETSFGCSADTSKERLYKALNMNKVARETEVMPDLDGDGRVENSDLLVLKKAWKKPKSELSTEIADLFFEREEDGSSSVGLDQLLNVALRNWRQRGGQ
ncbi:MAG: NHL repeat-containing protein [Candidatus Omnitrophica bacterium]|nr:NHL repeat-containing protein [Candidatus Omnitrophota bacterium]